MNYEGEVIGFYPGPDRQANTDKSDDGGRDKQV